jgi:protein phosphatase-4 regulatory subunit 3
MIPEVDLYLHLLEILSHFFRQHHFRSKLFILSEGLPIRVSLLLKSPEKHLKLAAIRFFRTSLGLQDEYNVRQMIQNNLCDPILQVLYETMPRNNLLNSACLEFFELIRREPMLKDLLVHLVSQHREKLETITYVETFRMMVLKYDQMREPVTTQELDHSFTSVDSGTSVRHVDMLVNGGKWGQGLKELDADEEAYFNGSDDDDDVLTNGGKVNGASPVRPLVNYPDDEENDEDEMDILATSTPSASPSKPSTATQSPTTPHTRSTTRANSANNKTPPERISEKRRREEEEEDELLANLPSSEKKRKAPLQTSSSTESLQKLRKKNSMSSAKDSGAPKKITISIPLKSSVGEGGKEEN